MHALLHEIRIALRSLRRRRAAALVVIGTMAVAIAATTTMLSVVNAAILRPLPFHEPERLVFAQGFVGREQALRGLSFLETVDWRTMSRAFDGLAAYGDISLNVADAGMEPVRAQAEIVSADFFQVLGARAALGRTFLPEEDRVPDAHPVAVIGHDLWQSRFVGRRDIVGRSITINSRPFTVVGVMPPGFSGLTFDSEVWIPMMMVSVMRDPATLETRASRWLRTVGRVKPGLAVTDAQRDLDRVTAALSVQYPATNTDRGARVRALHEWYLGDIRTLLLALFGAVGFLLLIACANVISLQLVSAAARRREMALRVALGAGRRRLMRQLLTEGMVLASIGAAGGVLLAIWGIEALVPLVPEGLLPAYARVTIDGRVLAGTALLTVLAGVAFGLAPGLVKTRRDLVTALKEGAPSAAGGLGSIGRARAQHLLVVGEMALALVLLAGASLMVRSLRRQLEIDPGFRGAGILSARLEMPQYTYSDSGRIRFAEQLVARLQALPGVATAAVGADLPLRGIQSGGYLTWEGGPETGTNYAQHRVSPEYFTTLGIRLERGRHFTPADGPGAPRVAIVSSSMALRLWPDRDPVGQRISLAGVNGPLPSIEVVGVVTDVRYRDLTGDLLAPLSTVDVYFPFAQRTDETIEIVVRSDTPGATLVPALRRVVQELDPTLPIYDVAPLSDALAGETAAARFGSVMLSHFAIIAMVLATVGIYGLLAFLVGTSSREIAIRMALGAASTSVLGVVVRKGMALATLGAALGLFIAVPSTRVLTGFLFGVRASDPTTLAGVTAVLLTASLLACVFPALRATRVDPQAALKTE
jgi:putative ABC transport system permease protein